MDAKTSFMLDKLEQFVRQRPGFDAGNYDSIQSLRADRRAAAKFLAPALENIKALRYLNEHETLTPEQVASATKSDRLMWDDKNECWDYTTGQYFPTEYRAAVWRVTDAILRAVRGYGSAFMK